MKTDSYHILYFIPLPHDEIPMAALLYGLGRGLQLGEGCLQLGLIAAEERHAGAGASHIGCDGGS